MKRSRFLIRVATGGSLAPKAASRTANALETIGGFTQVWSGRRSVMFVSGPAIGFPYGAIAGTIVRLGDRAPTPSLSDADGALIRASKGRYLTDAHWGGYVTLIEDDDSVSVLRAPLGDLPCLLAEGADGLAIASDVTLLELVRGRPGVDYSALARHLAAPDLRTAETGLTGVTELQGGLRLELADDQSRTVEVWSPWRFAKPERRIDDPAEAQRRLRGAVLHAVAATCHAHGPVILRLSGGLDSSIVAAALSEARIETVALTLVTDDPAGDERHYARRAAETLEIPLEERMRRIGSVDLTASAAANLPRPTARAFVQSALGHAFTLAAETGAGAIVDGGGGDNVFCSLQSIRPVIDALAADTGWQRARDTARSVAMLAQVSQWTVLRRAILARARHLSRFAFPPDLRLLSPAALALAGHAAEHRWLDSPPGALPGKAAHIGLIAAAQSVVEGVDSLDAVPLLSPLISQPVVETCLAIPSWLWFDQGHNRAIARDAFADLLPDDIVRRRSKGGPDGFIAELYRHHRPLIRTLLLDGLLMGNDLLDREALVLALAERGPVQRHDFLRIMQLVDAEIWARTRAA